MRKLLLGLTAFLLFTGSLLAQKTVTGTVTDNNGNPLPGVSVVVVGTPTGTVTKADGTYSIQVPENATQLQFSYLGFTTQTVTLGSRNAYSITLAPSTEAGELEGVIVTGIARVTKSQFTGAANKIDGKQLENRPVGSLDQLFQGRVPGVLAITGSGQPGNPSTIIIRGVSSVEGGSDPLYVVDGIPVEAAAFQAINPNDIASIDILRDAATLALYGSRGSAGVIVITTKRGKGGKMQLSYTGQFGVKSKPDFAFRPMTTTELINAQHDYGKIVGGSSNTNANLVGWYYSADNPRYATLSPTQQTAADRFLDSISQINVDWSDYYFKQGNFSNHQISISGGTGKTRMYSSLALYDEEGTTPKTDMKRLTLRNNVDYADERLTFSFSSSVGYVKRNFQETTTSNNTNNPFLATNIALPYKQPYKPDGTFATGVGFVYLGANALDYNYYDKNYNNQVKITTGFTATYKITKDLYASVTSGVDFRETQNTFYASKLAFGRISSTNIRTNAGSQNEGLTRLATSSVRPSLTYRKTFADRHDIEVSAIGEYVQEDYKNFSLTGYGIDPRTPNTPAAITAGDNLNQLYIAAGGGKYRNTIASGLAMLRYTFNDKYTLTGSYRDDGSSKLPKNTRWQQFYSVGVIWDISKEDFVQNIKAINVLRLRFSYGNSGNHNNFPGNYFYQAAYGNGTYAGFTTQGATYPGNPGAKWETTYVSNLGLDFELFNRRVYGDINLYDKVTKDLFVNKTLTAEGFGLSSITVNAGKLGNKGVEWNINVDVLRTKNAVVTLFGTGSYNKNELLSLGGEQPYESGTSYLKEGLPLGTHYEVKWGGVDAATGQPLYYDSTGKLTNVYSTDNKVAEFGTWEAPWKGGFGTNIRYKGLELSVLFSFQGGSYKYDNLQYFTENPVGFLGTGQFNQSSDLKFWQQPGDIVSSPSPVYGVSFNSSFIHNSSFVRLRDITLAYSLPASITDKIRFVSSARFYIQGNNLFIWTKWRGMDPEAGNGVNLNLSEFPNPRAITGGLTITF